MKKHMFVIQISMRNLFKSFSQSSSDEAPFIQADGKEKGKSNKKDENEFVFVRRTRSKANASAVQIKEQAHSKSGSGRIPFTSGKGKYEVGSSGANCQASLCFTNCIWERCLFQIIVY